MTTLHQCQMIRFPRIADPRGNLTFIEGERHIPFSIARAYWIYDVPGGEKRSGHAYYRNEEVVIALSGSFEVHVEDGEIIKTFSLNRSYYGLYVPNLLWRQLENFSTNAVCLVLTQLPYEEEDYLRDYESFLQLRNNCS